MTESEFNRLLALTAADCIRAAEEHSNPTETLYPELSPEIRARIRNHQRKTFARKQWGHRFTRVIAAMCAVFVVTVMCVPTVRAAIFNIIETWYQDKIGILFMTDETTEYPSTIEEKYLPDLSDGWEIVIDRDLPVDVSYSIYGPNDEYITVSQSVYTPTEHLWIDNDPVSVDAVRIGWNTATLYTYEDNAFILLWTGRYEFNMVALNTPRDTLLSIARSLKKTAVEPSAD